MIAQEQLKEVYLQLSALEVASPNLLTTVICSCIAEGVEQVRCLIYFADS
jgi:hypothetical protein